MEEASFLLYDELETPSDIFVGLVGERFTMDVEEPALGEVAGIGLCDVVLKTAEEVEAYCLALGKCGGYLAPVVAGVGLSDDDGHGAALVLVGDVATDIEKAALEDECREVDARAEAGKELFEFATKEVWLLKGVPKRDVFGCQGCEVGLPIELSHTRKECFA